MAIGYFLIGQWPKCTLKKEYFKSRAAQGAADEQASVKETPSWAQEVIMNSNQKKTGGLAARVNRSEKNVSKGSLSNLRIVRGSAKSAEYAFPKPKLVPAGQYRSKIVDILESTTKQGEDAVDVHYDFTSGSHLYRVKMRYPLTSSHFDVLCDALINAGIPENSSIKNAVNVEEMVELDYPNGATMGSIVSRRPVASTVEDVDDDDEDLLDDDDDDLDVD